MKKRIDILLCERGVAPTRAKARAMILAGEVYAGEKRIEKAGQMVDWDSEIKIKKKRIDYVSRGGAKLAQALDFFKVDVHGFVCVDVGASTGGFTECLLKRGAAKVYAVDVGHGQLAYSLRKDERVVVMEKTNIRKLEISTIADDVDLAVIDVSFIGLEKVFPKVDELLDGSGCVIALIKPQFEVGRGRVPRGGVVRSECDRIEAVERVKKAAETYGWRCIGVTESPVKGAKGNIEYLACWRL